MQQITVFRLTFLQARIQELESSNLSEKEEFESQLAEKEAAEEELQKQKEDAENEVFNCVFNHITLVYPFYCLYTLLHSYLVI